MEIIGAQRGLTPRERLGLLKRRLRVYYRDPERLYRLNAREASDTGREYTDAAIDAGELVCALGRCTARQQQALALWLGPKMMHLGQAARTLHVSVITVKRDTAQALKLMLAQIWDTDDSEEDDTCAA